MAFTSIAKRDGGAMGVDEADVGRRIVGGLSE
jgi:hypothetical protein